MDSILEYLPKKRQTLLYSATQTKNIDDLARVSVKNPFYVNVDQDSNATPSTLQQVRCLLSYYNLTFVLALLCL